MPPRVRFPPSPSGDLHLGGARTALYNFLFAKKHNGTFLLRIEDTDTTITPAQIQHRTQNIINDLQWLNINPDNNPPSLQSAQQQRHQEVATQLLQQGKAYNCFDSTIHTDKIAAQKARSQDGGFRSPWRDKKNNDKPPNSNPVVRLKTPQQGTTAIEDSVKGTLSLDNAQIDDFVLLRSDGSPTYMLSVVVDDYDSHITHIIRGDDHLTNAFRQQALYQACRDANIFDPSRPTPAFTHIPMVLDEDGARLSKRKGSRAISEFRKQGFLPEAVVNFLLRLGWGHKDQEIFSLQQAIDLFNLEGLSNAPARISYARLENLNAHYLRTLPLEELQTRLQPFLPLSATLDARNRFFKGLEGLRKRATTLHNLVARGDFYLRAPTLPLPDAKAQQAWDEAQSKLPAQAWSLLSKQLAQTNDAEWTPDTLSAAVRTTAQSLSLGFGDLAKPLRAVCTGRMDSPDLSEVLAVLGKKQTLERVANALSRI